MMAMFWEFWSKKTPETLYKNLQGNSVSKSNFASHINAVEKVTEQKFGKMGGWPSVPKSSETSPCLYDCKYSWSFNHHYHISTKPRFPKKNKAAN